MSKTQVIFLLLLSIVFGLAAVFVARQWMEEQQQPEVEVERIERHPVVIAAQNIPAGVELNENHLTTKLLEVGWLSDNHYRSKEELVGMISKDNVFAGEIINGLRMAGPGEGTTLASMISKDKRAITIRVNDVIGVAGFLLPGNKVDILNTIKYSDTYVKTATILKDVRVLAVDQTARTDDNKPVIVRAVTLELSPLQAEKLLSEKNKGSIQLALRNPKTIEKKVVRKKYIPRPTVTIIKGSQTSKVSVKD
ncbi:Flp pilus assembly protein CpaB [Vibrio sp. MACH09]|uniref:Flp pilus assembly protein CpaB n=1 Tax=unclassified Vibrio TaxID=2614977 RepID=UPI001493C507|nr:MULTISPECIES: Flp pilus assembly protein CpaB [unclassified Vibrio]NOI64858.1 Flp pilus assembly protein CpaB [Vibrio sp. 99-8-1]GLO61713.1 Flp pilus assembly protein CpaB [Vibrio sp. MACH09]